MPQASRGPRGARPPDPRTPPLSYKVLALKYRPTSFDEVVGQTTVTRTLQNALERGQDRPRVPALRRARRRQDHDRAHPGQGAQLREGRGADRQPVLDAHRGEPRHGLRRAAARSRTAAASTCRRSTAPRTPASTASASCARWRATARPATASRSGSSTRSTSSRRRLQRAAEDARGAAAARQVHLRHHRVPQDPGDDPLALPAVRLPDDLDARARAAPAQRRRPGADPGERRRRSRSSPAPPRAACATRSRSSTRCSPSPATT